MKQMTGEDFLEKIKKDPSWCLTIKTPITIEGTIHVYNSEITHLSPLLHFKGNSFRKESGDNENTITDTITDTILDTIPDTITVGESARFLRCKNLKHACGNFYGWVLFEECGIETTKGIKVHGENRWGASVSFLNLKEIKSIEGEFESWILVRNCKNITPNEKYLSGKFDFGEDFKRRCEQVKLRKKLTRLPEEIL